MTTRCAFMVAAGIAVGLGVVGCSRPENDVTLQGSGATFPAPIYKRWFLEYYKEHPEVRVNYTPIGSGAGIRQFTAGLVNFGASDAGMSDDEIKKLPPEFNGALILPMTAGVIVLAYDVPGVSVPIRLSREAYIKIFLREITNWNDVDIAKSNPGVQLPDLNITVVTRADSSGTSYAFSNHMAAVAKALKIEGMPKPRKSPEWKESIRGSGNDGVAALIQLTPGAIGYLEYGYAELAHLSMATLENHAGKFVAADPEGKAGRAALAGAKFPKDIEIAVEDQKLTLRNLQIKVPDPTNPEAYPIATYTWVLCRATYPADQAKVVNTLKAVFHFCLEDRQQETAAQLGYLRMPDEVVAEVRKAIDEIKVSP
jgi:phosphate transport system substrate-binding protein